MSDLRGKVAIPTQAGKTAPVAAAETAEAGESNLTFGQVELTPKRVTTYIDLSRLLIRQSSLDIQRVVIRDLMTQTGLKIQDSAFNGTGSNNQPLGIRNVTRIGAVPIGANGGALTRNKLIDLKGELRKDNAAMGKLGFAVPSTVQTAAEKIAIDAGSGKFLWEGVEENPNMGRIVDLSAYVSNSFPSNLTKGTGQNLSTVVHGNFEDLLIGQWGGIDLIVNPYTKGKNALIELVIHVFFDAAVNMLNLFRLSGTLPRNDGKHDPRTYPEGGQRGPRIGP